MTMATLSVEPAPRTITRDDYDRFLPMVRRVAMRLVRRLPRHIAVDDLVGAGWVGLMEACSRSESSMPDEEFAAYASHRVKGAMLDYLRQLDPATRRARHASRRVAKIIADLRQQLGRPPDEEEIANGLGLTLVEYRELLSSISSAGMTRLDMVDVDQFASIPSCSEPPDEIANRNMLTEAVAEAIETTLNERQQLIIALYYQEGCTMKEIGAVLTLSESRICQIHAEAMHRLRAAIGRT